LNWKRVLIDPSFWILLIANAYLVYKYEQDPDIFSTLVWLYWSQSMLYGLFTCLTILTTKMPVIPRKEQTDEEPEVMFNGKKTPLDATAFFFLGHYGFFHLVYFFFLIGMTKLSLIDWTFFKYYLAVFFVSQAVSFIQHKFQRQAIEEDFGKVLVRPYLRVIPMHLCILIPAFMSITSLTVFLVLKVVADVFMYVLTSSHYKRDPLAELTAVNIKSTATPE
jgi:hypothetical protein